MAAFSFKVNTPFHLTNETKMRKMADMEKVLITIHSGSAGTEPNSVAYLEYALKAQADIMEVDVHASKDGKIVLCHDQYLKDSDSPLEEMEYARIEALSPPLLSLEEVLHKCRMAGIRVNLDIKHPQAIKPVVALLQQNQYQNQVLFTGCQEEELSLLHQLLYRPVALFNADRWDRVQSYFHFIHATIARANKANASALNINAEDVEPVLVQTCREEGLPVYVWTVDEQTRMEELIAMGVASITTHEVALLRHVLARL